MVLYHIGKRFPRLKEWFSKCCTSCKKGHNFKKRVEKVFVQNRDSTMPERGDDVDVDTQTAYDTEINYTMRRPAVTFSQFREPCLEQSGSIEIITVPAPIN